MNTIDKPPKLAKVAQAAEFLTLSRSKVYSMMDCGELPYVKIGKARRIRWDDLEALVERSRVGR